MSGVINNLLERFIQNYDDAERSMTGLGLVFAAMVLAIVLLCLYIVYKIVLWPFTGKAPIKPTETSNGIPPTPTIPPKPTGIPTKPKTTSAQEDDKEDDKDDNKEDDEPELPIEIPEIKLDTNTLILLSTIVILAIVAIVFFMTRKRQPKRRVPPAKRY